MKRTLIICSLLLFSGLLTCSCTKEYQKLPRDFTLFIGKWKRQNSSTIEIWEMHNHTLMGKAIRIENKDTVLLENLRIIKTKNEMLVYNLKHFYGLDQAKTRAAGMQRYSDTVMIIRQGEQIIARRHNAKWEILQ